MLAGFEERRWLVRDGPTYGLTPLGEYVADWFLSLQDAMEIEGKLRDVQQWLPVVMPGFSVDRFADALVSYPAPGYPYEPVERLGQLIGPTSLLGGFDTIVNKSSYLETACGAVLEGTTLEYVFTPEALKGMFAWNSDRIREVAACENATVLVHDHLPDGDRCGIDIVDARVGICCHDAETRAPLAVINTDAPKAREWAISVFEQVRAETTPVHPATFDPHSPS